MNLKKIIYGKSPSVTARVIAGLLAVVITFSFIRVYAAFDDEQTGGNSDENNTENNSPTTETNDGSNTQDTQSSEFDFSEAAEVLSLVNGKSAVLCNLTDSKIMAQKNLSGKIPAGQATIFMVALTVSEAVSKEKILLSDDAVCPASAAAKPGYSDSSEIMPIGKRMKISEILKCLFYQDGASFAYTLAVHISGSEQAFVAEMNNKCKELGLTSTYFSDCTGDGSSSSYTSAYDIAVIIKYVMKDPLLKNIFCSNEMLIIGYGQNESISLVVKNNFFENYCTESQAKSDGIIGGKVAGGRTDNWAAVIFFRDGKEYLSLVCAGNNSFADSLMIYSAYALTASDS